LKVAAAAAQSVGSPRLHLIGIQDVEKGVDRRSRNLMEGSRSSRTCPPAWGRASSASMSPLPHPHSKLRLRLRRRTSSPLWPPPPPPRAAVSLERCSTRRVGVAARARSKTGSIVNGLGEMNGSGSESDSDSDTDTEPLPRPGR
jgi:hypothetical protein